MIFEKQKTIEKELTISGIGLHTGNAVALRFKPAPPNTGISFIRVDLADRPVIKAHCGNVLTDSILPRCTSLGDREVCVHTVEHLMAVLAGLKIDNLTIEINNNELPGLDGSGLGFLKAIKEAGIEEQDSPREYFDIPEPMVVEQNGSAIFIVPGEELSVSYILDYNRPFLGAQFFSSKITPDVFEAQIASCRTFCLEEEVEELKKRGLGKGASYENSLVVTKSGVRNNELRFKDEFVRHKVLDFLGDLYLLGAPVRGHVFAIKSGHTLNIALVKKIRQEMLKSETKPPALPGRLNGEAKATDIQLAPAGANWSVKPENPQAKAMDIQGIMKILPHRYPFLLVDRIVELEKGKKAVGIKNVTVNDSFFQGHFPSRPVMPGVLMIEAMAQTAGIAVLTNENHQGKVAFFMAADKIKFRKPVVPGDQLYLEARVIRDREKTAQIHAQARVNGEIAAEAEMLFSFVEESYLHAP